MSSLGKVSMFIYRRRNTSQRARRKSQRRSSRKCLSRTFKKTTPCLSSRLSLARYLTNADFRTMLALHFVWSSYLHDDIFCLHQEPSKSILLDQLGQKLMDKIGSSWSKKFRKHYGPIGKVCLASLFLAFSLIPFSSCALLWSVFSGRSSCSPTARFSCWCPMAREWHWRQTRRALWLTLVVQQSKRLNLIPHRLLILDQLSNSSPNKRCKTGGKTY